MEDARRQVHLRTLMVAIVALAPCLVLARFFATAGAGSFLAMMAGAYAVVLVPWAWCGRSGGRSLVPLAFAFAVSASLVASWYLIRESSMNRGLWITMPEVRANISPPLGTPWTRYFGGGQWQRLANWEAWSLLRWWMLFGVLTWASCARLADAEERARRARSLLWFAPWLALMEVGYLGGVWLAEGGFRVVPEPSTLFAGFWSFPHWLDFAFLKLWLIRGLIPTSLVGLAFFRIVLRRRWRSAIAWTTMLIPVALYASVIWSSLYLWFLEKRIVQ